MKKFLSAFLSVLLVFIIIICAGTFYAFSAESDFQIEDGVLVAYNGTDSYVSIPNDVYYIGDGAFENNKFVQTVLLNSNVAFIGNKAFYNCASLTAVGRTSSVTSVGAFAFDGTPFMESRTSEFFIINGVLVHYNGESSSVEIPEEINSVAPYAFYNNTNVTSLKIAGDTVEIGEGAFYGCVSLESVSVPQSVTTIGAYAFYDTLWLNEQSGQVTAGDNILIAYNGSEETVTIKSDVKKIAPCAFINNRELKSVTVPSGVYMIGQQSFMGCEKLSTVNLSSGVIFIDEEAFAKCTSLSKCYMPKSVKHIGKGAFAGCTLIERLEIGGDLQAIGYGAFAGCESLKVLYVRDGNYKTAIADNVFYGCGSLKMVRLSESVKSISARAFNKCDNVTVYTSDEYVTEYCLSKGISCSKELGDVDGDGLIGIKDSANIQLYLANLAVFTEEQKKQADADYSGSVTIEDAAFIQLSAAKLL